MKQPRQFTTDHLYRLIKSLLPNHKLPVVIPKPTTKGLSDPELHKALSILSMDNNSLIRRSLTYDFNSTPATRNKFVTELTAALNEANLPRDKKLPMLEKHHFEKVVDGLSLIESNKFTELHDISLADFRKLVRNIGTEQELVKLFDTFYYTGELQLKFAIEILLNKNLIHIDKITSKVFDGNRYIKWSKRELNDFDLSILQKLYQLKEFDKLTSLLQFFQTNEHWVQAIRNGQVSPFAERTLWKFALKFTGIDVVTLNLTKLNSATSVWLLLESFQFFSKINNPQQDNDVFHDIMSFVSLHDLSMEQKTILSFLTNEFISNDPQDINSILSVSMLSHCSVPAKQTEKDRTLITRELTRKLLMLEQKYEDYDFSALQASLDEFVRFGEETVVEENDRKEKMVELGKLFGF